MFELEINQLELASAMGMSKNSLSARMTGRLPWSQDEMYLVCDYINARAKDEGLPKPFPYERLHEIFPPRRRLGLQK